MIPLASTGSTHRLKKILHTPLSILLGNTLFRLYEDYHVLKDQRSRVGNYNTFLRCDPEKQVHH